MDEPCSALDPVATLKIEELIDELKERYTIVIVTHNMQQAARVATRPRSCSTASSSSTAPTNDDLHQAQGRAHRALRHREVRVEVDGSCKRPGTIPRVAQGARAARRSAASTSSIQQLDRALEAISYQDVELAGMVVADDDRIDGRYLEVHQGVLSLLARQAPVAGDLRIVAALLHIIRCVERMGDQCVNIAKLVPLVRLRGAQGQGHPRRDRADGPARPLAGRRRPKEAFAARNVELAQDLVRQDAEINRLNREIFRRAVEVGDDLDLREWAMFMILVARCLERIGDNTVDIAEQVVFVVTGLFREMADASQPPPDRDAIGARPGRRTRRPRNGVQLRQISRSCDYSCRARRRRTVSRFPSARRRSRSTSSGWSPSSSSRCARRAGSCRRSRGWPPRPARRR